MIDPGIHFKPYKPVHPEGTAKEDMDTAEPIARNASDPHPDSAQNGAVTQALLSAAEVAPDARFNGLIGAPE